MMDATTGLVQVFAKAPVPGRAKTRLIPALGAAGAARLHAALVRDTLALLMEQVPCAVELWCAPDTQDPFFSRCAVDFAVTLRAQSQGDLGIRMQHALSDGLSRHPWVLLIGCDCPSLEVGDIFEAAMHLQAGSDVVLGPAVDGGYYLIGLRHPMPSLFEAMPWGSDRVLQLTTDRLAAAKVAWRMITEHRDLDRPEDLCHFPWLNTPPTR